MDEYFSGLVVLDMTTVIIRKTVDGSYQGFTCMGHSGYAGKGSDIVCASVSVLVINAVNSLEKLAGQKMEVSANDDTGFIHCRFSATLSYEGKLFIDSMIMGLSEIAKQYGRKYLTLKFKEV